MTQLTDLVTEVENIMFKTDDELDKAVANMMNQTRAYVKNSGLKSLVVGVSGGLDSAVVSAILQECNTGVPLIGVSIPMSSSDDHKEQAQWVGNNYCTAFDEFKGWDQSPNDYDDDHLYDIIDSAISGTDKLAEQAGFSVREFPHNILRGNIKARLRMITLYDLARKTNGMVLSTDNLSEYLAGFWTINGDVGDWGIIQNIWKGFELPQIAKYVGVREDIITQKPSDGLSVTEDDTDEAQLGMTYQEFDTIISIHTNDYLDVGDTQRYAMWDVIDEIQDEDGEDSIKVNAALNRHSSTNHKRVGTINIERKDLFDEKY